MPQIDGSTPGAFCWAECVTSQQDKCRDFYVGLFGWVAQDDPIEEGMLYTTFKQDGRSVAALFQDTDQPAHWNSYICVENVDATAEKVVSAGGTLLAEPFDVMDIGRMCVIQDPTGAVVCAWQPGTSYGWQVYGDDGTVGWNELQTRGKDKAIAFYSEVFGWGVTENPYASPDDPADFDYTVFAKDGVPVAGAMEMTDQWPPEVPPSWTIYFGVADCDATVDKAGQLGGMVVVPAMDTPAGRCAVLADPGGSVFSVIAMIEPPA